MAAGELMTVEVAYATTARQMLLEAQVPVACTALEAVRLSGILERWADIDTAHLELGVFGVPVPHDQVLRPGDRVEIYRPLKIDPREARRWLAAQGQSIGARRR